MDNVMKTRFDASWFKKRGDEMKKLMKAWELMEQLRKGKGPEREDAQDKPMKGIYDGDKDSRQREAAAARGQRHETLADDGEIAAGARDALARDEALVREVLGMVGVDYDALIVMDGQSPYAQAVAANPTLVQDILTDERPVLAALKAAFAFKPVAEFTGKYGSRPDEIRANIRKEVMAEMQGDASEAAPVAKGPKGPLFSSRYGGQGSAKTDAKTDLQSLFGR